MADGDSLMNAATPRTAQSSAASDAATSTAAPPSATLAPRWISGIASRTWALSSMANGTAPPAPSSASTSSTDSVASGGLPSASRFSRSSASECAPSP